MAKSKKNHSYSRERNLKKRRSQESSTNKEILEQLERQRRKQVLKCPSDEPQIPQLIENFEYDSARKAYFPKSAGGKGQTKTIEDHDNHALTTQFQPGTPAFYSLDDKIPTRLIPSLMIHRICETCSSPRRYEILRSLWTGRLILKNMQVVSSARMEVDAWNNQPSWRLLFSPLPKPVSKTIQMPWDLACKSCLHSSSQTFDVQQRSQDSSRFPDIATLVDGGVAIRFGNCNPLVCTTDPPTPSSLGFHPLSGTFPIRFTPRLTDANYPSLVVLTTPNLMIVKGTPPFDQCFSPNIPLGHCNAIAFHPCFGKGNAAFAVAPQFYPNTNSVIIHGDFDTNISFQVKTKLISKSDALCVEYLSRNVILFGHRDGSISSCDTRMDQMHLMAKSRRTSGSVTSILPLADGCIFLARKSFGSCLVFDIRKTSRKLKSAALWDLRLPGDASNQSLSSFCSGIAVDPAQEIAVSPFANDKQKGQFALWSLTNGQFLGSKSCQEAVLCDDKGSSISGVPHCELCPTITASWHFETDQDGRSFAINRRSNSWSLWFKSWEANPCAPSSVGSIHQLSFSGSSDELHS